MNSAVAVSWNELNKLVGTKKRAPQHVQLNMKMEDLQEEQAVIVIRGSYEDNLYKMYMVGAIEAVEVPPEDVDVLEVTAFVLGKRDCDKVQQDNGRYLTKDELVGRVYKMTCYEPEDPRTGDVYVEDEKQKEQMNQVSIALADMANRAT